MTDAIPYEEQLRQHRILDQSDDVRDPGDDSDEFNDPTEMANTYPGAFDGGSEPDAQAAIQSHDIARDRRHGGGNG